MLQNLPSLLSRPSLFMFNLLQNSGGLRGFRRRLLGQETRTGVKLVSLSLSLGLSFVFFEGQLSINENTLSLHKVLSANIGTSQ